MKTDTAIRFITSAVAIAWVGYVEAAVFIPGEVEIVVERRASPVLKFAGGEMKHFLDGVLSCEVPVVETPSGTRTPIYLGASKWTKDVGISVNGMKRDEFRIVATDKAVFIAGRDDPKANPERALQRNAWSQHYERATLFGVYEFLERYAGVRMYFPGELGEVVPRLERVEVPPTDFASAPSFSGRYYSYFGERTWFEGEKRDAKSTGHLRWLHTYRLRMQTRYVPFNHGLSHRGYLKRFGDSHPEYFRLNKDGTRDMNLALGSRSGKLCYTSGVWEEIYQDAKSYLNGGNPKAGDRYIWGPYASGPCDFDNFGTWEITSIKCCLQLAVALVCLCHLICYNTRKFNVTKDQRPCR